MADARRSFDEMVTDRAGRHVGPTQAAWGAPMTDDHNLRLETERRLIKRIAKHIEELVKRNDHDGCWLAAHKEINHQILDELPPPVRARIEKNLFARSHQSGEKGAAGALSRCLNERMITATDTNKETKAMIIITWNVVTKNLHANDSLLKHMREQINQLEEYLPGLPPDSAHLLVELERDFDSDTYTAALSLRLAGNILRSQQPAKEVKRAFDAAVKDLASQLRSQKTAAPEAGPKARFSDLPMAQGTGPQSYEDVVREQQQRQKVHA